MYIQKFDVFRTDCTYMDLIQLSFGQTLLGSRLFLCAFLCYRII